MDNARKRNDCMYSVLLALIPHTFMQHATRIPVKSSTGNTLEYVSVCVCVIAAATLLWYNHIYHY
jgi:hypothetical protein